MRAQANSAAHNITPRSHDGDPQFDHRLIELFETLMRQRSTPFIIPTHS